MIKSIHIILSAGILLFCHALTAQVAVKKQPPATWFSEIHAIVIKKAPKEQELLSMQHGNVPPDLDKILKASDWIEAGNYHFTETSFSIYYRKPPLQYDIARFLPDGGALRFSVSSPSNGGVKLTHTNFENPPPTKWNAKAIQGRFYIEEESYGEKTYISVVSYNDGVLVLDISMNGAIGEKANFRSVMIAIPKAFTWSFDE